MRPGGVNGSKEQETDGTDDEKYLSFECQDLLVAVLLRTLAACARTALDSTTEYIRHFEVLLLVRVSYSCSPWILNLIQEKASRRKKEAEWEKQEVARIKRERKKEKREREKREAQDRAFIEEQEDTRNEYLAYGERRVPLFFCVRYYSAEVGYTVDTTLSKNALAWMRFWLILELRVTCLCNTVARFIHPSLLSQIHCCPPFPRDSEIV